MGGRTSSSGMSSGVTPALPSKTVMADISKYTGYARDLAETVKGDEVYQIKHQGGDAFADAYINSNGDLRIDYIGSTGKGAGSELLARLAEKAYAENRSMTWMADNPQAVSYYKHIGLSPDANASRKYSSIQYVVKPDQLLSLIRRLRDGR